jgi:uncharacterized paraquat-inducible protein A
MIKIFKGIKNMFEQKEIGESSFIFLCACGVTKEAGGSDRCPRCGDKMRKKKVVV